MNIHFYISNSFPYGMAAAKRRLCYAIGLMAEGHEVDVVVCQKCFEKNDDDGMPVKGFYRNIPYIYVCGKFKHRKQNKILRYLDYYFFDYIRSFWYALKHIHREDIIYAYYYPILLQMVILLAAKIKRGKVVKETCEHPSALGKINSKWHHFCKWFEYKFVMPQYDGFIAISRELQKFVCKYKSSQAQCIIVPILVEQSVEQDLFTTFDKDYSVPYILHTGTMHEQKDSISKILHAFSRLKSEMDTECRLVFTGPQANDQCSYIPLMKRLGIEKDVDLLGYMSVEQITALQKKASMTIIYKSDNLQTRNCFPTKLGEMLISGIPVITTTIGDTNVYLEHEKSAFIFAPDDEVELVRIMKYILQNPVEADIVAKAGQEVAKKYFNPIYQGKRLSNFYKSL